MKREKIVITGAKGLVGSRFAELLPVKYEAVLTDIEELDILDRTALVNFFKNIRPRAVVNFAAFTDVDKAEAQRGNQIGFGLED